MLCHLLAPPIQATSHRLVAHYLPRLSPTAVQEVFDLQHPAVHAFDLRELARPGCPLGHDRLQARQLLRTARAHRPPFFESRCRLASTSSRSSAMCTAAKSSGARPSRLSAESTPVAYSSSAESCVASSADLWGMSRLSCLRSARTLGCKALRMAVWTFLSAA